MDCNETEVVEEESVGGCSSVRDRNDGDDKDDDHDSSSLNAGTQPRTPPLSKEKAKENEMIGEVENKGFFSPKEFHDGNRLSNHERHISSEDIYEKPKRALKSNSIVIEKATKFYGKGKKKVTALQDLSMRVPHGSIYGLLGPSGCGKTTLLGCIVNRLRLDGGKIFLFGFPPGSKEAAVPGGRVGYMPQEIALYQEFTIQETLQYIGRINQLHSLIIKERTKFLVKFLDLPDPKRLINQLSGGQQRRVSLAAALLHEPELLILDEPTVGVDPLLRSNIWKHLIGVCGSGNTTIVITTHYIEEANQADRVGLMRNGRLLAESSPSTLIEYFGLSSLEKVFLYLCMEEGDLEQKGEENSPAVLSSRDDDTSLRNTGVLSTIEDGDFSPKEGNEPKKKLANNETFRDEQSEMVFVKPWVSFSRTERSFSMNRNKALIIKNIIRMKRNVGFLIFSFILPAFQTILFCLTIGGAPHDLPVAVVNLDVPPLGFTSLADSYLDHLDSHTIKQKEYGKFDDGYESVEDGTNWGFIFMNKSFTSGIILDDDEKDGTVHVYMDDTNSEISITIKLAIYEAFGESIKDYVSSNPAVNISSENLPLVFEEPVYEIEDLSFRNFVAPGVLITIIYFMAVGLTSLSFIIERKEGLLERSWVSGVRTSEVLFAHLVAQLLIMVVQITLVMIFMFPVFQIPCEGSLVWVILLCLLQGICGMSYGLMVSGLSKDEITAIQIIMGTFYPVLLISGIVWPVEGMPNFLRYISYIFPQTYACDGIRAVLYRGWDITYFDVYIGYIITLAWLVFHLGIAMFAISI